MLFIEMFPGEALEYGLKENTGIYYLLVFFLLLLGAIRILEPGYFRELFRSVIDLNYIALMSREGKLGLSVANILLDLIFVGSVSFYIFQLEFAPVDELKFFEVFLWVLAITIGHLILTALLGKVFFGMRNIKIFLHNVLIFNRVLGIILLPLVFLGTYVTYIPKQAVFYGIGALIILYFVFRILRALLQMGGMFNHGIIYNFFYLCTVEISPLIVVIELITGIF